MIQHTTIIVPKLIRNMVELNFLNLVLGSYELGLLLGSLMNTSDCKRKMDGVDPL